MTFERSALAGDALGAGLGEAALPAQPCCDQSSTFCGTAPFTKDSMVENGEIDVGSRPEP
jgi:hypothetical protein